MATQEEWREAAYQRTLGARGSPTGSAQSEAGYVEYLRRQRNEQALGAVISPESNTFSSIPVGDRFRRRGGEAKGGSLVLALAIGAGAYFYWNSLPVGIAAAAGSVGGLWVLKAFFTSPVGGVVVLGLDLALRFAIFVGLVAAIWAIGGVHAALWFLGGIAALLGIALMVRFVADNLFLVVILLGIGVGAYWFAWPLVG